MDIFCGKHGNKMSDLYCSYVSTTTTTNVTYKHTHSSCRTVPTETRREKCKAEWEGRFVFVCYTHYYQVSSQFGKSNEVHTPYFRDICMIPSSNNPIPAHSSCVDLFSQENVQSASFACCCVNMTGECLDRQTSHTLHSDTELLVKLHTRWRARFTDATPGPGAAHNFS